MNSVLVRNYNLPFTHVVVWHNGRSVALEHVLVDTGSASTIFKLSRVDKLDSVATEEDTFGSISGVDGKEPFFYKTVEAIELNGIRIEGFDVDIGHINYGNDFMIDGIIDMDLLQRLKANINIEE